MPRTDTDSGGTVSALGEVIVQVEEAKAPPTIDPDADQKITISLSRGGVVVNSITVEETHKNFPNPEGGKEHPMRSVRVIETVVTVGQVEVSREMQALTGHMTPADIDALVKKLSKKLTEEAP